MKLAGVFLLCCLVIQPAFADVTNLTLTVDGITYSNVTFGTVTPASVSFRHSTGAASILLEKLPPDLQKRFDYDAQKAAAHRALEWTAQKKRIQLDAESAAKRSEVAAKQAEVAAFEADCRSKVAVGVRTAPPDDAHVPCGRYLVYHAEAYLHEHYIFEQRLRSYLKQISRAYRQHPKSSIISSTIGKLDAVFTEYLKPIVGIRGKHVHVARYGFCDVNLRRLLFLEAMLDSGDSLELRTLYDAEVKRARKEWQRTHNRLTNAAEVALRVIFMALDAVLLNKNGCLIMPAGKAVGLIPIMKESRSPVATVTLSAPSTR